jgi:hypothetical protein
VRCHRRPASQGKLGHASPPRRRARLSWLVSERRAERNSWGGENRPARGQCRGHTIITIPGKPNIPTEARLSQSDGRRDPIARLRILSTVYRPRLPRSSYHDRPIYGRPGSAAETARAMRSTRRLAQSEPPERPRFERRTRCLRKRSTVYSRRRLCARLATNPLTRLRLPSSGGAVMGKGRPTHRRPESRVQTSTARTLSPACI